jgi:hypothetical protein
MERIDFACSYVTFILPSRWICFVTDPGFGACSRFSSGASPFAGKIKVLLCFGCCRFWIKVVPLVVDFSFGQALRQQFGFPLACHCIQDFPKFLLGSRVRAGVLVSSASGPFPAWCCVLRAQFSSFAPAKVYLLVISSWIRAPGCTAIFDYSFRILACATGGLPLLVFFCTVGVCSSGSPS